VPLPKPERGLFIAYSYLWHGEFQKGRVEGVKDRLCVIIVAVTYKGGTQIVTVAPITHAKPATPEAAVEIPLATKRRLGLDDDPSWVVITEGNRFEWPGPDIRPVAPGQFDYGFLPPALFHNIQEKFAAFLNAKRLPIVPRTEQKGVCPDSPRPRQLPNLHHSAPLCVV